MNPIAGIGTLIDVGDVTKTNATESQLKSLREAMPEFGQKLIRSTEKSRELYESAATEEEVKLKATADEFVSILYGMLFKQMDSAVPKSGFMSGGKAEEMFQSMILDEHSKSASSQGNNPLAHRIYEMLYDKTSRKEPPAVP